MMVKKLRRNRVTKDKPIEQKYVDLVDHHCPSFLRPPHVVGNRSDAPDWCFLPKAHVLDRLHQDISDIRWFPKLPLLLLSCSTDQDLLMNLLEPPAGRAELVKSFRITTAIWHRPITIVDESWCFVTTSDDESLCV
ncbi:hypothetical protein quinque_000879 [Culex quinquefasciatus]